MFKHVLDVNKTAVDVQKLFWMSKNIFGRANNEVAMSKAELTKGLLQHSRKLPIRRKQKGDRGTKIVCGRPKHFFGRPKQILWTSKKKCGRANVC